MPRQPSLWFKPASATSLRSPVSWPWVSTNFLGTMNKEMPLVPAMVLPSAPGIFANTKCTMFSVNSWSPVEIHILLPLSLKRGPKGSLAKSGPSGVARVATSDKDEPA